MYRVGLIYGGMSILTVEIFCSQEHNIALLASNTSIIF